MQARPSYGRKAISLSRPVDLTRNLDIAFIETRAARAYHKASRISIQVHVCIDRRHSELLRAIYYCVLAERVWPTLGNQIPKN